MSGGALFVTGTDTDAGKTFAATALCRALREKGLMVGVFKPAETGCAADAPPDALALIEASGCAAPLETVCPYRLPEPMAPAIAARRAGVEIDLSRVDKCLEELRANHDITICEGAGGLLVPLTGKMIYADWLEKRRLPTLLVGRLGLGTINHTLLSARYLKERGVPLAATILSATEPPTGAAAQTNPEVLAGFAEVEFAGVLEHADKPRFPAKALSRVLSLLG